MDHERFLRELPLRFDDFPRSEHPRDRRFAEIVDGVENLAAENNLALLNLAAACLDEGEAYVEAGVYHGASLIAAMLGNEGHGFVGIDDFSLGDSGVEVVERNLARFALASPELIVGDIFETVSSGALDGTRVGVWYYDAAHSYESQVRGIRVVEPWLVPGSLVVVDDTDWADVERAIDDYLEAEPRAREVLALDGKDRGSPQWWEGMRVLVWDA